MIQKLVAFLKEVRSELSQVSWPPRKELWGSTRVVLMMVLLLSAVIGMFDFLCAQLVTWMVR